MTIIGVLSKKFAGRTEKLIRDMFASEGKKTVRAENAKITREEMEYFEYAGVDFLILTLKKDSIKPIYLDILVLERCEDITNELIKCVAADTRLIYYAQGENVPVFVHPNAISCGMAYKSEATASSIDYKYDGISFVYCLQRPVETLEGEIVEAGEKKVYIPNIKSDIDSVIAAVTCSMICGINVPSKVRL